MTRSRSNNNSSDIWKDTAVVTPLRSLSSSSLSDDKNGSVSSIAGNEKRNTRKTTQQSVSSRPSSSSSDSQDAVLDTATSSQKKRKRVQVSPATSKPETPRSSSPAPKRSIQKPTTKKSPAKKAKSSPKKSPKRKAPEPGTVKPPSGWEDIYSLVEELREDRSAPVDSDGGEELPDRDGPPEVFRFQVLIALMLSSQTKDAVVGETMRILQKHGLTIDNISNTTPEKLNSLIRKVGFHNNKTKYIKQVVEILREEYDGDIPQTADDMMKLPGIGPKVSDLSFQLICSATISTFCSNRFFCTWILLTAPFTLNVVLLSLNIIVTIVPGDSTHTNLMDFLRWRILLKTLLGIV